MESRKVLSSKNNGAKLPFLATIVLYLLLDKFNTPEFVWGIVGTIMVIYWIAAIYTICHQEEVDIFDIQGAKKNKINQLLYGSKSKFQKRLDEAMVIAQEKLDKGELD